MIDVLVMMSNVVFQYNEQIDKMLFLHFQIINNMAFH